jgi:hypothetical protein
MITDKARRYEIYEEINQLADVWWDIESPEDIEEYLNNPDNPNCDIIYDLYNELQDIKDR